MVRIFFAYSSLDKDRFISDVAERFKQDPKRYTVWYYDDFKKIYHSSINEFIVKLDETDLFVVFISRNSLNSNYVIQEIYRAITLYSNGSLKEILPLLIDNTLSPYKDQRIPIFFKKYNFKYIKTPFKAISAIERCCSIL